MKTTISVRVQILAAVAAAAMFLLARSTSANESPRGREQRHHQESESGSGRCCQMPSIDGTPSCFAVDESDPDECAQEGGQVASGSCNADTGLCGGTDVCCAGSDLGTCSEVTADQCGDADGTSILGEMCDVTRNCRNCLPEGSACPASGSPIGTFDTGACCSGAGQCALLGAIPVDCSLAIVDVPPVFTCSCTAVPAYYTGASLNDPPSTKLAALFGAGAVGLLLPVPRRRRRRK